MRKVLNVGGNSKKIKIPFIYDEWEHILLDIDPGCEADVVCDAREMLSLPGHSYDVVYCSHNLEHYYQYDVVKVLAGFRHVMKPDGFVHIVVPNIGTLVQAMVQRNLDLDDVYYNSPGGPVTVRTVLYGHAVKIEQSGCDFYAHKTGFTTKSLTSSLALAGFPYVTMRLDATQIIAYAFLGMPNIFVRELIGRYNSTVLVNTSKVKISQS